MARDSRSEGCNGGTDSLIVIHYTDPFVLFCLFSLSNINIIPSARMSVMVLGAGRNYPLSGSGGSNELGMEKLSVFVHCGGGKRGKRKGREYIYHIRFLGLIY